MSSSSVTQGSAVSGGSTSAETAYRWRAYATCSLSSDGDESVKARIRGTIQTYWSLAVNGSCKLSGGGFSKSWSGMWSYSSNPGSYTTLGYKVDQTITIAKSTSAKTVTSTVVSKITGGFGNGTSTATVKISVSAGVFEEAAKTPSNLSVVRNSDTQLTFTWKNNTDSTHPVTKNTIDISVNEGSWTQIYNGDDKTSHTYTSAQANSCYQFRISASNSTGKSGIAYSDIVYTTPAAPSSVIAIRTGDSISLSATVSNIRYPDSYEWQRSASSDFSNAVTLSSIDPDATDTTSLNPVYYRIRCLGQEDNLYSAWTVVDNIAENPLIYVRIPDGATMSEVYIRVDD